MNLALTKSYVLVNAAVFLLCIAGGIIFEQPVLYALPFLFLLVLYAWRDLRILFFLLIAAIPFSTEVFFENGLSTDFPDEQLMWLTGLLTFMHLAFHRKEVRMTRAGFDIIILLAAWFTCILVSCLFSNDPLTSLKFAAAKCWYFAAFVLPFLIFGNAGIVRQIARVLLASTMVVAAIIVWQHSRSGFSFATINEAVRPFFRNHVNYSALLVCVIPLAFWIMSDTISKYGKWLLRVGILLLLFAVLFSYARGAWVALVAGLVSVFLVRRKCIVHVFAATILVSIMGLAWLAGGDRYLKFAPHFQTTVFHENFREHLVATYQLKDISTAERFHRWIAGVRMTMEKPLTGFGPNRFTSEYSSYTVPAYKTWVSDNPERSGVHNYYLLLASEQGIPSLVIFLILALCILHYCQRFYHSAKGSSERGLFLACGAITVSILVLNFLSDLIETDKVGSIFFLVAGILAISDPRTNVERIAKPVTQEVEGKHQ